MRALILAAGAGRRFGGPKQLATFRGRTVIEHVVEAARALDPLVVLGAEASRVRAVLRDVEVVVAEDWAEGQAASLRAGVAALGDVDAVMVFLADQPLITAEVVAAMPPLEDFDAVRPTYGGVPGHPVVLGRRLLAAVPSLRGDVGARELLRSARVRTWEAGHLADPTDIDTPDQLEAIT